jgi:hypothetical protein
MSPTVKSAALGPPTSRVEVTNISPHGFWLFLHERELFLAFRDFPWFREASIGAITNVELPGPGHLYWPDLDVDLAWESIEHPEAFPLVSHLPRASRKQPSRPARRIARKSRVISDAARR